MARKWTFTTNESEVAHRMARCDDAYSLLWEISQKLRNHYKYGAKGIVVLKEINEEINESGLMELWT